MESVMKTIRDAREAENQKRLSARTINQLIDGCHVRIQFDALGDDRIMTAVQSMLVAAYTDNAFAGGGECA